MLTFEVDLAFELDRQGQVPVRGQLSNQGDQLVLEVSDPSAFAGSGDAASIRMVAESLAVQGLAVHVVHDGLHIVSIGAVNAPWWQRRLTGSRRIRVVSLRGAWTSAWARTRKRPSLLPGSALLPPLTLFPLVPTLGSRRVTTTHDPGRGGNARLVLVVPAGTTPRRSPAFWLLEETTIGSDPGCDIVLPGLEAVHARIRHDEDDEWMIDAASGVTRVHGGPVVSERLRTGALVEVGPHRLVFHRDEYADHGRPYGGRSGGELGRNIAQPERPRQP